MLTPLALRVISRIRRLNRSRDFGAIVRLVSGPAVKLNPRNFRSCGRATALFASFTLSLSFWIMKREMLVLDGDKIVLDPDQEVQGAVRAVFELFEQDKSAYAVVQHFHEFGLLFPRRSYGGVWDGKLIWGRLTHSRVLGVLANPSYAGTYVFGRYQSCKKIGPTGEICTQLRPMPQDQWRVVIPDHHPAYITWDQFAANRKRLAANKTNCEVLGGPAREGLCLLQSLLLCGVCGRRLTVRYTGNGGIYPIYECNWSRREAIPHHCISLAARPPDDAIAERLLTAVTPLTIKLALEALASLEERDKIISAQWYRKIERARYEADLAERRYEEADPSNRLVASTLEKRWNNAMQRLDELEAELATFERRTMRSVTAEQKQQILELGRDFPRLWKAPTTSACDRKRMLRLLIAISRSPKGQNRSCCACKFAGRAEQPKQSRSVSCRTVPKQSVILIRSLPKSAPWHSDTMITRSSRSSKAKR
jgi:hypothetical protein